MKPGVLWLAVVGNLDGDRLRPHLRRAARFRARPDRHTYHPTRRWSQSAL